MGFGFGWMDAAFPVMFTVIIIFFIGTAVFTAISGIKTWNKNNNSPRLTVDAKVISKRMDVSRHLHPNAGNPTGAHGHHMTSAMLCYVTFEVESGDRIELQVSGAAYGMLAEGDAGKLDFQGTRYLAFERIRQFKLQNSGNL